MVTGGAEPRWRLHAEAGRLRSGNVSRQTDLHGLRHADLRCSGDTHSYRFVGVSEKILMISDIVCGKVLTGKTLF